jgi:preprotein translocase subunit Sec63
LNPKADYYAILGATENSSAREIDRHYRQQAHKHHPDRGGAEEDMKALNEAYGVLRDKTSRKAYDDQRRQKPLKAAEIYSAPAVREVGVYGQLLSAVLCVMLGIMLLLLVRFNGLWFLWPMSILAAGVILFGVIMAHAAMTNARNSLSASHPVRRFRAAQEIGFWLIVVGGGCGLGYLIVNAI